MAHFEVFQDKRGVYRYRVRADNGEIVAQSEGYESKESAKRGTADLVGVVLQAKSTRIRYA